MARTNRNNQEVLKVTDESSWLTAIYARLSIEDNGIDSDSIETQIYFLQSYVKEHKELKLIAIYCDNGLSGTSFDRPELHAMLEDIKSSKINCVVVKDLSRFGRNYMETGNYLESIFPCLGVRFISVNDHYDSMDATSNEGLALSLKNIYHHIYAKDISRKVCTLLEVKKKKGLYLGRFAPYGYKKSETNPYQLELEEITAPVVREIYSLRMSGIGAIKIARRLNDKGIPCQSRRLFEMGLLKGTNNEASALWSGSSIISILENPVYCGCIVERKSEQSYYKGGSKRLIPKDQWNYIKNTHEAIIDWSSFMKVQYLLEESRQSRKNRIKSNRERTENRLKGLVICGCCQGKMIRDSGYFNQDGNLICHRFICRRKYLKKMGCLSESVLESDLLSVVRESVGNHLRVLIDFKDNATTRDVKQRQTAFPDMDIKILEKHQAYKRGLLSQEDYIYIQKKYGEQKNGLETEEVRLKNQQSQEKYKEGEEAQTEALLQLMNHNENGRLWNHLIDKIIVSPQYMEIHYTFCSEYEPFYGFMESLEGGE